MKLLTGWWTQLDPAARALVVLFTVMSLGIGVGVNLTTTLRVPGTVRAQGQEILQNTIRIEAMERAMILHICEERSYRHTPPFEFQNCVTQLERQIVEMRRRQSTREQRAGQ